jgi:hypothetical protein
MPVTKVVQLNAQDAAKGRTGTALPPVLQSVRHQSLKYLGELLEELFNNADDALFEMADRSRNDTDQNLYFDSMRQLRLHRNQIVTRFSELFYINFEDLFKKPQEDGRTSIGDPETTAENLALVQNDDLEMAVAISGIVSKVTSQLSIQLMQLTRRIDALCPASEGDRRGGGYHLADALLSDGSVTERRNPLGPYQLATAFVEATRSVEIHIRVRIILLKLFERFVMERMGTCYDVANRMLAEAGVLTNLKTVARRAPPARPAPPIQDPHPGAEASPGMAAGTSSGSGVSAEFALLQELLSHVQLANGVSAAASPKAPAGPTYSTPELISLLSSVQSQHGAEPIAVDQLPQSINLGQLLAAQAQAVSGRYQGMGRTDEDTVNLIGMLFDYILNDRNLAIPMKALIGRLQIPMLKVAILDKTFFSRPSHPARQLLNELSSAGIGWSTNAELKRDALYTKIESIVVRVLNHFEEDFQLFESLVAELRSFMQQDDRRTEKVEQRVVEAETGKAKTVAAKRSVQQLINQKASGLRIPEAVSRFIAETWSRVLVYLSIKYGSERREWTDAVGTLDDLLWCVQPLDDLTDIDQRDTLVVDLLERVHAGIATINLPPNEIAGALSTLQEAFTEIADYDRSFLEDPGIDEPPRSLMSEIVLTAVEDDAAADAGAQLAPELSAQINRITDGVWVEFTAGSGEKLRCKLSAIVQPGNRYIFVNRRGMKVRELTRMALAIEIENGTVTILEESQVFDRALEAVIGNLRQMHQQPPKP